jgi:hypothetical protein
VYVRRGLNKWLCLPSVSALLSTSVYCSRVVRSDTAAFASSRVRSTNRGLCLVDQVLSNCLGLVILKTSYSQWEGGKLTELETYTIGELRTLNGLRELSGGVSRVVPVVYDGLVEVLRIRFVCEN